jgi:hypothetical protein
MLCVCVYVQVSSAARSAATDCLRRCLPADEVDLMQSDALLLYIILPGDELYCTFIYIYIYIYIYQVRVQRAVAKDVAGSFLFSPAGPCPPLGDPSADEWRETVYIYIYIYIYI